MADFYIADGGEPLWVTPLTDRWPGSPRAVVTIRLGEDDSVVRVELVELN